MIDDLLGKFRNMHKCKDCKMIAIPKNKEYCSFCDPNEFMGSGAANPVPAGIDPFQEGYHMGYERAKREDSKLRSLDNYNENPFKFVVIEGLVNTLTYRMEHETNARLALDELIDWHCTVALDRRVSEQAEDLYQEGKRDAEKINLFFLWLSIIITATIGVCITSYF